MKNSRLFICILLLAFLSIPKVNPCCAQDIILELLSESSVSGSYSVVTDQGNYAFASTGYGVAIFNISDPSSPVELLHFPTQGLARSVSVAGEYLYVCDEGQGLLVYNISNMLNPLLTDTLNLPGSIRSACPYGDYLYVTAEDYGLQIVDCSDPNNLELVDIIYTGGETYEVVVVDNWLYVSIGIAGLAVYDITNPEAPEFMFIWNTTGGKARGLYPFPSNDYLAVADYSNGVYILDLTYPWVPTWNATVSIPTFVATTVTGAENYGACAYWQEGIQTFNTNGSVLDYLDIGLMCAGVYSVGDYLYVIKGDSGLGIVNCESPNNLYLETNLPVTGQSWNCKVMGNIAYVANMLDGLTVVDISDRSNPVVVDNHPTGFWAKDVLITPDQEYLYVADFATGIHIFDLDDPWHPAWVDVVSTVPDTAAHALEYRDGYLYCAVFTRGLNVFDVTNPIVPELIYASPDTTFYFRETAISEDGQHLFAVASENGMPVYSLYPPDSIVYEYTLHLLEDPIDIIIQGNYAYVANMEDGVFVLDVSNYAYVFKVDSLPMQSGASGICIVDADHIAATDWTAGVSVINVSNPTDIYEVSRHETPGYAHNVSSDSAYLYVSDVFDLSIFDLYGTSVQPGNMRDAQPEDMALYPAYPNPFNASTTITFAVSRPGTIKIAVYDISGREVDVLCDRHYQPGGYSIRYNAQNLASGIYIASLEAGDFKQAQKLLLVK
ncbi:MAG: T9SS type A sorting domain-containing protein [bacterium]